ncbi:MAG: hypothetical protein JWO29_1648 [Arthrobacter sp.]|nr:hypothetical protein [Arthrobacter sp.]
MKNRALSFLVVSAVALAGCGGIATSPAAEPFEGKTFTSIEGSAPGEDLSWVASRPLQASFSPINGSMTMVIRMPCGVLNVPVSISADVITANPTRMAESADGCAGPEGEYRSWTRTFLKAPLSYSRDKGTLVLSNNLGRVTFQESEPT